MTVEAGLALRRITDPFNRFKITRVSPKNSLTLAGWFTETARQRILGTNSLTLAGWFTETARQAGQQMIGWLLRC